MKINREHSSNQAQFQYNPAVPFHVIKLHGTSNHFKTGSKDIVNIYSTYGKGEKKIQMSASKQLREKHQDTFTSELTQRESSISPVQ